MPLTPKGNKILGSMEKQYGADKGKRVFYASRNAGKISGVDPESSKHMPTGTPGHFSGGAQGSIGGSDKGKYDTATQTYRKAPAKAKPAAPKSKGGFAGKTSTIRPLTSAEHSAAAEHLANAGQHEAAAHHRAAADSGEYDNADDAGTEPGQTEPTSTYSPKTPAQTKAPILKRK